MQQQDGLSNMLFTSLMSIAISGPSTEAVIYLLQKHNHNRAIELELLPEWSQGKSGMSPSCETGIVGTEQMCEL